MVTEFRAQGALDDPIEPTACFASPVVIDLSAQTRPPILDIFGLDFDRGTVQLVMVTTEGYRDVTSALSVTSSFHAVVDIAAIPLSEQSQSLDLAWGHLIHLSVPLIQPTTRLCASRVETIPSGKTVSYTPFGRSTNRTLGASDSVWADVTVSFADNKIEARLCVLPHSKENGLGTGGCTVEFLYTTDPDRLADGILNESSSRACGVATTDRRS
jgi:hypothetical protein